MRHTIWFKEEIRDQFLNETWSNPFWVFTINPSIGIPISGGFNASGFFWAPLLYPGFRSIIHALHVWLSLHLGLQSGYPAGVCQNGSTLNQISSGLGCSERWKRNAISPNGTRGKANRKKISRRGGFGKKAASMGLWASLWTISQWIIYPLFFLFFNFPPFFPTCILFNRKYCLYTKQRQV